MDILVGPAEAAARIEAGDTTHAEGVVQARFLAVRPSRHTRGPSPDPSGEDRRRRRPGSPQLDPPGARVLTLLVPDPAALPKDLGTGSWRVVLRFIRTNT